MTCTVPKDDQKTYVDVLVLDYFQTMVGFHRIVTLGTSLGIEGLDHSPGKRRIYRDGIATRLLVKSCAMRTLTGQSFADTGPDIVIGDISDMVLKDLA